MNQILDKLIIQAIFVIIICLLIFVYKYAHSFFYPSSRLQLFKRFYPSKNGPQTIHLLSRIIGIGLIFSEFNFYLSEGIVIAILDFLIQSSTIFFMYLISIYIVESIVLYNFEYSDEILKRKNYSYSIITFTISLTLAYILKTIIAVSHESLVLIFFIWPFSIVILGFATKSYSLLSKLPINRLIIQQNIAVACSYSGFLWGWTFILSASLNNNISNIYWYSVEVILKLLLSIIVFPLFKKGIQLVYKMQDDLDLEVNSQINKDLQGPNTGYGVYEGTVFFTACFLTTVITNQIHFGDFYPKF